MLVKCSFLLQPFQSAFKICTLLWFFSVLYAWYSILTCLSIYSLLCSLILEDLLDFFLILETFAILFFKVCHFYFFLLYSCYYMYAICYIWPTDINSISHTFTFSLLSVLRYFGPDWPWTCFIFEDDLQLLDLPAYISLVLGSHQTYIYKVLEIEIKVFCMLGKFYQLISVPIPLPPFFPPIPL